jgi:hypothetical protein
VLIFYLVSVVVELLAILRFSQNKSCKTYLGVMLPPGGNFTNILRAAFSYESFLLSFLCLQFGFVIFWRKDFGAKAGHKMLVKLTPVACTINVYDRRFYNRKLCSSTIIK